MRSDAIEEALEAILQRPPVPQGIVITLRRHDEYEALIERIRALEAVNRSLEQQIGAMSAYPVLYLEALDELRLCRKLLQRLGVDTSFIQALRQKR